MFSGDFKLIKPTINVKVILSALSIMMLNVGANISFGGITESIREFPLVSLDHIPLPGRLADNGDEE